MGVYREGGTQPLREDLKEGTDGAVRDGVGRAFQRTMEAGKKE